jgi:hypothetical protein
MAIIIGGPTHGPTGGDRKQSGTSKDNENFDRFPNSSKKKIPLCVSPDPIAEPDTVKSQEL